MSDVFISYKREDLTAVNRLVEALRAEDVSVWWDQDIPPNAPWEATIEKALAVAKLVIVAWSPDSVASDNVKAEARLARGQGRLLQVFVEACEPPLFFGERQGVDLKGWSGGATDPAFRTLLQAVCAGQAPEEAASEAPLAPLPLPSKPSIAVMPFANLSSDPEQEYFADGMMEEIVNALSRFRSLFVIASGSTLTFKGKAVSPQEVARQLGVRYVLEGSVRRAVGRVRIAVKLVDADDGAQIWGDRFDDVLEDVFALQDKVALSVAGVIEPAITDAEARRVSRRPPENMSSYDLYLMGYAAFQAFRKDENLRALDLFERAIQLDPKYAAGLAMAAECHSAFVLFGWTGEPEKHRRLGLALAERALVLAGSDDWVLALIGNALSTFDAKRDRSVGLIDRAIALNPGSAYNWLASAALHLTNGDDEDIVIEHAGRAMRLDPLSAINRDARMIAGVARFRQRRFAEALSLLNEASSPQPYAHAHLATVLGHLGHAAAAREALARYRASSDLSIEEAAQLWFSPELRKLFLDGIALAEVRSPPTP